LLAAHYQQASLSQSLLGTRSSASQQALNQKLLRESAEEDATLKSSTAHHLNLNEMTMMTLNNGNVFLNDNRNNIFGNVGGPHHQQKDQNSLKNSNAPLVTAGS